MGSIFEFPFEPFFLSCAMPAPFLVTLRTAKLLPDCIRETLTSINPEVDDLSAEAAQGAAD
jgi:hypothetical protein